MFVVLRHVREYFVTSPLLQNGKRPISKQNNQTIDQKHINVATMIFQVIYKESFSKLFWGNEIPPTYMLNRKI